MKNVYIYYIIKVAGGQKKIDNAARTRLEIE